MARHADARPAHGSIAAQPPKPGFPFGLLGSLEFKTNRLSNLKQWSATMRRYRGERAKYIACELRGVACHPRVKAWRRELNTLKAYSGMEQLRRLNRYLNRARPYREDINTHKRIDHWTTPLEFLHTAGDCEDYAIIKFFSLLELGYDNAKMRIVVVHDTRRRIPHAVLALKHNGTEYILDSLFDQPAPHEFVLKYRPVYSVNLNTRWAHVATPQIRMRFADYMSKLKAYRRHAARTARPARARREVLTLLRPSIIDDDRITRTP